MTNSSISIGLKDTSTWNPGRRGIEPLKQTLKTRSGCLCLQLPSRISTSRRLAALVLYEQVENSSY